MSSASPTRSPIGMRGLSDGVRVLEDDLQLAAQAAQARAVSSRQRSVPPYEHAAGGRLHELEDGVAGRRLAAARIRPPARASGRARRRSSRRRRPSPCRRRRAGR